MKVRLGTIIVAVVTAIVCGKSALAELPPNASETVTNAAAATEARTYVGRTGESLNYRIYAPERVEAGRRYPLVLFLHGAGERGDDNVKQLFHPQFLTLISGENRVKNPAFLIAPQCPVGKRWCETNWAERNSHATPVTPSDSMTCLLAVVDQLRKEFSLDKSRLYVTGMSMGGYGTCDFVCRRGNEVAAYVPLCGGADNEKICQFKNAKGWFFHGDRDPAVPVERSRSAVAALKAAGCDVKYTELPGRGHDIWREVYYTPGFAEWLFEQKLK